LLKRQGVLFINDEFSYKLYNYNKIRQRHIRLEPIRETERIDKVYIDLCSLLPISRVGERYYLLIVNNYTRYY